MTQVFSQMALGLSVYKLGYHRAAWRMPDFPQNAMMSLDAFTDAARAAEDAKFDFVFFADISAVENLENPARDISLEHYVVKLDPIVALSAISAVTSHIGLVGTVSTTYTPPYRIARQIASLDVISHGRAGWNVVTSYSPYERQNFGVEDISNIDARYARAHEAIDVVQGLWNSWDPDAFVADKTSGQYFDREKLSILGHEGDYFSVKGPLDVAPSPQGMPVMVSAGDSPWAREMAAKYANIQYAPTQGDLAKAQEYYRDIKSKAAGHGRDPRDLRILPGFMPIIGETDVEAAAKHRALKDLIHPKTGFGLLMPLFGDLSKQNLDTTLPRSLEPDPDHMRGFAKSFFDRAMAENWTIRQCYEHLADGEPWFMTMVGSAKSITDTLEEWFHCEAADGFNLLPDHMPGGFTDFVSLVLPDLRRRGLFRTEYSGTTLRERLRPNAKTLQ